jgi:hypothetical protein
MSKTIRIPLRQGQSVPIVVEESGWRYDTGSFFSPMFGEIVSGGPIKGSIVVHLTQGPYAKQNRKPYRFCFAGGQVSAGTVGTPVDTEVSSENFSSWPVGQIYRVGKVGDYPTGAVLSDSGGAFAKTQEAGRPRGFAGFCLIGSYGVQAGVACTVSIIFLCAKVDVKAWNLANLMNFRYVTVVVSLSGGPAAGAPLSVASAYVWPEFN